MKWDRLWKVGAAVVSMFLAILAVVGDAIHDNRKDIVNIRERLAPLEADMKTIKQEPRFP